MLEYQKIVNIKNNLPMKFKAEKSEWIYEVTLYMYY